MTSIDGSDSRQVSDRGLRAFVAAARAGSLTNAARDLGLGQPAVSHAIRRLEAAIGATLLERSRSGVAPTPLGAELLARIEPAIGTIDAAVASARGDRNDPTISLLVSTSLATWWLLPRLPDFKRQHPDLPLRLVTTDTDSYVEANYDLWIPLGLVERADTVTTTFCAEALIPVATPALASSLNLADHRLSPIDPRRLLDAPLLHLEERYAPRFDWPKWFAHHDIDLAEPLSGDRSTDYSLVLQAALDGQGVALGWSHLVVDLITNEKLVPLADPVTTQRPFVIVADARKSLSPEAEALSAWLVESMRISTGATMT